VKTRLVHTLGGSRKFWEGSVVGKTLVVRWGRIGSEGQSKTKSFGDAAAATKELHRLLAAKRGKGYVAQVGASRTERPTKAGAAKAPVLPARPTEKAYRVLVTARLKELRPKLVDELRKRIFPRKFPAGTKSLDYEIFFDGLSGPVPIVGI
jgi:predicted DNA-binding WGR domain protein